MNQPTGLGSNEPEPSPHTTATTNKKETSSMNLRREHRRKQNRWIRAQRRGRFPNPKRWFIIGVVLVVLLLSSCTRLIRTDVIYANPSAWDRTCYMLSLCGDTYDIVTRHYQDAFQDWRGCWWLQKRAVQFKDGWWSGQQWDFHEWVYEGPSYVGC